MNFKSGWRKDLEDLQSLRANAKVFALSAPADAPEEIDPRSWMQIENQGAEGSCAGHMMSSILELCNFIKTGGSVIQLSRAFCYLTGQKACGLLGADQGCTIEGVMRAAHTVGICREETFPYTGHYSTAVRASLRQASSLILPSPLPPEMPSVSTRVPYSLRQASGRSFPPYP